MDLFGSYDAVTAAVGAMALLMLIQITVADVLGIKHRHLPGSAVETDHSNPLFRATRAVANTNESVAIFVLLVFYCVMQGADTTYTAYGAWGYVAARAAYAICYYANQQMLRSVMFGLALLMLVGLLVVGTFF